MLYEYLKLMLLYTEMRKKKIHWKVHEKKCLILNLVHIYYKHSHYLYAEMLTNYESQ